MLLCTSLPNGVRSKPSEGQSLIFPHPLPPTHSPCSLLDTSSDRGSTNGAHSIGQPNEWRARSTTSTEYEYSLAHHGVRSTEY